MAYFYMPRLLIWVIQCMKIVIYILFFLILHLCVALLSYFTLKLFFTSELVAVVVWRVPIIPVFSVLSIGLHCFASVVRLLCSLSGWLHLNCSSIGTGFNGAETSCRIAELHTI